MLLRKSRFRFRRTPQLLYCSLPLPLPFPMAEIIGVVAAALQFVVVLKVSINIGLDARNAPKEQQDLAKEMDDLKPLLTQLQDRLAHDPSATGIQELKKPLERFNVILKPMLDKLATTNKPGMKAPKAFAWTLWNKKEVHQALQEMERIKALLSLALTMNISKQQEEYYKQLLNATSGIQSSVDDIAVVQMRAETQLTAAESNILEAVTDTASGLQGVSLDIKKTVDGVAHVQNRAERERLIDWISPLNFFPRHSDIVRAYQKGTGTWFIENPGFKEWTTGHGGVLWGHGMRE
ncbi:hypothetical protein B0H16DRAFT_375548 [Mycena metata]|uniref:NACHT-NTPase and P-loop NTPases N-terminal domain-containing protein n=1 Tax=Mycena metata TaxID=1033252 RepID=A0AAD7HJQ0_9AGAR|nr:hypothetical protein B0H16DRAFT_375548 [Mycena metata]